MHAFLRVLLLAPLLVGLPAQSFIAFSAFDTPNFENGRSMGGPNLLLAIKIQPPQLVVAMRLEIFTGEHRGTNTLALWSHDPVGNLPLAVLGQGSWEMSRENGWQGCMLTVPIVLNAGQDYWLVWGCQDGSQASSAGTGAGAQPYRGSFNGGASWNGPFQSVQWKLRIWTGSAGHYTSFGSGCSGPASAPELNWIGTPFVGATYDLHLQRGPANGATILVFGTSDSGFLGYALPYALAPHGAPGCAVLAAPLVTLFVLADSSGRAQVQGHVPNDPAFAGQAIYSQWFCLDAGANALGLTVSNGGAGIVGL
jgi:hypothetical protein